MNILVVDDHHSMLELYKYCVKNVLGRHAVTYLADDAFKALDIAEDIRIDMLISDIHMPGMDGPELVKEFCSRYEMCENTEVYLASNDAIALHESAIRLGGLVDGIIHKYPDRFENELKEVLDNYMRRHWKPQGGNNWLEGDGYERI